MLLLVTRVLIKPKFDSKWGTPEPSPVTRFDAQRPKLATVVLELGITHFNSVQCSQSI